MNEPEAKQVLAEQMAQLRQRPYAEWRGWISDKKIVNLEIKGPSGAEYQIEIMAVWDGQREGNIRVLASIDDGRGWRAFFPLCDDFIIAPDSSFVGE